MFCFMDSCIQIQFGDKGLLLYICSGQLLIIKPLSGKAPVDINILNVGEAIPSCCAVFPVYAVANVYFEVKDRIQDAKKEAAKFKAMLTEAQRDQQNIDGITAEIYKA